MSFKQFPKGFYWGAATASYQVEGGIENCDWAKAALEGKVPPIGRACDHYNRYEEDFDIAGGLGHNCHRISLEWSRIEPEEGKFDNDEIEHYRAVLQALNRRGMKPFVTIWHYTLPLWFSESGGFLRPDAVRVFADYARRIVEALGSETDIWITMNEPEVYAIGSYGVGVCPPFRRHPIQFLRIMSTLARAHKEAYHAIKSVRPDARVGIAKQNLFFESNRNPFNRILHVLADWFWNHRFLAMIRGHQDFVGLNQYHYRKFGMSREEKQGAIPTGFGCYFHPDSLYECLRALRQYSVPVYVLENGLFDAEDTRRPAYIVNAVRCLGKALEDGVPLKGYIHWTLIDNYEWISGYTLKMGLVEVDFETQERRIRPSAYLYKDICEANALTVSSEDIGSLLSKAAMEAKTQLAP